MDTPRYSTVQAFRWVAAAAMLSAALVFVLVSVFDPLGMEQRRIDRATSVATRVLLCERVQTTDARLAQLQATAARLGITELTRNERDVLATMLLARERLAHAERVLRVDCITGDERK